ncbi:MAG TPA: zf-HC2 domain-containing protein [Candidatus Acidoferrum sp.]|nr:zf-HC2 domain-containing protein [Candidatus Acidoferrum sp.]
MNCRDITRLAPLYITGELEVERAAEFDAHLRTCSSCIEEVERQARADARLREVILAQEYDATEVDRRVRGLIAAEAKGHQLPRFERGWRRWTAVVAGFAAALVLLLVAYLSLGAHFPRVYADAATDHRLEVVEHQPRHWLTDPEQIALLAEEQAIAPAVLDRIASGNYRLVRGKLCYLDRRIFLHLVFSDGTREFSLYLRPRDAKGWPSGPVREIANRRPLCTVDFDTNHVASVETPEILAFLATDQSADAVLTLARFVAAVL